MSAATKLIRAGKTLTAAGLMPGTTGNLSLRTAKGMLLSPSGMSWDRTRSKDLVELSLGGERLRGKRKPTTEWRLHGEIYRARPDVQAIVHTHSPFATVISCLREEIPAVHYMIAAAGVLPP